ncbi:MAG: hypothetical protein CL666_11870 [Balneola sp.]|nr:hypothetical protein [Balneola sp.]|tara:strand:- start:699 stop:1427 length:729 start_codon:yes stop_codon:yes gene_type:complete
MADHSEHIRESLPDEKIGGAIKATPGRPPAEFYSSSLHSNPNYSVAGNYYHERCLQLEGQLNDANRKNQQITDELFQARKDLSQDKTELLLAHQNEIARLKEEFRDKMDGLKEAHSSKVSELEKTIDQLDREQFRKDLEYKASQQSPGNQITEHLLKKSPDLVDAIGGIISIIAGQRHGMGPVPLTPGSDPFTSNINDEHASETADINSGKVDLIKDNSPLPGDSTVKNEDKENPETQKSDQ